MLQQLIIKCQLATTRGYALTKITLQITFSLTPKLIEDGIELRPKCNWHDRKQDNWGIV